MIYNSFVYIIQDEVLAHRLGLIPIKADPKIFKDKLENEQFTEENTIVFTLNVTCPNLETLPIEEGKGLPNYMKVFSKDLKWVPQGKQV